MVIHMKRVESKQNQSFVDCYLLIYCGCSEALVSFCQEKMETTRYIKKVEVYRTIWTIPDFSRYIGISPPGGDGSGTDQPVEPPACFDRNHQTIFLNGKADQFLNSYFRCYPNGYSELTTGSTVLEFVVIDVGKSLSSDIKAQVTLGMPDKNGELKAVKKAVLDLRKAVGKKKHCRFVSASVPHLWFKAAPERLLPSNRLTLCIEVEILHGPTFSSISPTAPQLKHSASENCRLTMLDTFVDIGPSSVVLVFEDGELRCHTFPLASRNSKRSKT